MRFFHQQLPHHLRVRLLRSAGATHRSLGRRRPFHLLSAPSKSRLAVRHRPPFPMSSAISNPWPGLVQLAHRMYTDAANAVDTQRREFEAAIETAKQRAAAHIGLDEFTDNVLPALKVIAESLEIMGRSPAFQNWTSAEWLLGLTVLAQHNTSLRKKATDAAPRQAITAHAPEHRELVQDLLRYVRICDAVYADTVDQFCKEANLPKETVVKSFDGSILSPKFLLLRDDAAKEIMLVIRGTASILDFMTDICLVNEPFADGQGHRGMVLAAQWLVKEVRADLVRLTHKHRGYKLVVTGHSLGAGVSALVAMQLKPSFPNVRCVAFAAPASVTQNLAIACQDYVTTVVNGDDCVPRLHQHSMVRLQEELAKFDWRAALKQMVDEEVAEHANYIAQKRDEHLQAVYDAFQSLKESQKKQAESKLAQVLETPLVSASLELTKAAFATDAPPLERLASVKQVVRKQQQKSDDVDLWDTLEATVDGLERLARAIHQPSERQALLVKSQRLLLRSASESKLLRSSSSVVENTKEAEEELVVDIAASKEEDKWSLFRQRIKSVVDETTQSLKEDVERTLDDVSDSVEQLKRETEAEIEESVVAIQEKMRRSAEAIVKQTQETALGVAAIAPLVKEYQVEEQAEGTMMYGDGDGVDPDEQTGTDPEEEAERVEDEILVTECAPPAPELLHEPLFPPGRIVYLNRLLIADALEEDHVALEEVAHDRFSRVVLSNTMILDHLCTTYERVLQVSFQAMAVAVEAAENKIQEEENR